MRPRPHRIENLPEQYFTALLARVAAAAAEPGEPLIDLGRGNPDVPPPEHVVEALVAGARESTPAVHGYAPFAGLPELREAIAVRYAEVYGVELDPDREVAVVPGTKTALVELALCTAGAGEGIALPDPGYPDYNSGCRARGRGTAVAAARRRGTAGVGCAAAAAGAHLPQLPVESDRGVGTRRCLRRGRAPSPTGRAAPSLHDFAYGDLVFDGRRPSSFLAEPGAREVGVELFSMSKSYGMAGWRLGFVVGQRGARRPGVVAAGARACGDLRAAAARQRSRR